MAASSFASRPGPPARVLLVEDDRAFREMIADALETAGYEVQSAASGAEALGEASTRPPDLLLSDVMMPGMSGVELAVRLRMDRPDLPVIFMSGYSEAVLRNQSLLPEDSQLLRKPFPLGELEHGIRQALAAEGRHGRGA